MRMTRRAFSRMAALAGMSLARGLPGSLASGIAPVALVRTTDRRSGIAEAVGLLGGAALRDRDIYLKASYNSPDLCPATTHPEALEACLRLLLEGGARRVTLVERSGMGQTREVLETLGVVRLCSELGVRVLPLEDLEPGQWRRVELAESHWSRGVEVPYFLDENACVVQLCTLKTHRFGGEFSASLKNSIGLIAKYGARDGYNYMRELHGSPEQCRMIAEANLAYVPALLIMDAVETFVAGGPESGDTVTSGVIAASCDRVALDAVGAAILHHSGAEILDAEDSVFGLTQIARAVELHLGSPTAERIRLIAGDAGSVGHASLLEAVLRRETASH